MWQIWTSGILGIWIILLAFLDFSSTLTTFFLVATGVTLAALNFWMLSLIKAPERQYPDSEILPPEQQEPVDDTEIEIGETSEDAEELEDNTIQNN